GHVRRWVLVEDGGAGLLEAPQVHGDAGELQAVVGHVLFEPLPIRLGRMRERRWMGAEATQLDAFVAEILQLVQDDVEVGGRLVLIEDVRPAADGELFHGGSSSRVVSGQWSVVSQKASRTSAQRRIESR